jgi:hypothetical protein
MSVEFVQIATFSLLLMIQFNKLGSPLPDLLGVCVTEAVEKVAGANKCEKFSLVANCVHSNNYLLQRGKRQKGGRSETWIGLARNRQTSAGK